MSTSELTAGAHPLTRREKEPRASMWEMRLLRSELRLVLRRRRNLALLVVLSGAPILLGIAVRLSSPSDGEGPPFLARITENGLFLAFTSLVVTLPLFLPLGVAVAAGESVAGEASSGTLRGLLVVPVSRTRLLAVKYAGIVAFALACTFTVAVVGVVVGLILFPHGDVTLLSGTQVSFAQAVGRATLVSLYVAAMLAAVGAIGLFISTLTEVAMGAMAATAVLTITSEIASSVPQIHAIHPYLFTNSWLSFGDLLRSPIPGHDIGVGLFTQAVYIALFLSLAWARLGTKDVSS